LPPTPSGTSTRKWTFSYFSSTGPYSVSGYGSVGGIKDLLSTIRTPSLYTSGGATKHYQVGYTGATGEFLFQANVVVDPDVSLVRHAISLSYSSAAVSLAGTFGFETSYLDRESNLFKVVAEYKRNL